MEKLQKEAIDLGMDEIEVSYKSKNALMAYIKKKKPVELTAENLARHEAKLKKETNVDDEAPQHHKEVESVLEFPAMETVEAFVNYFCEHYIMKEQELLDHKLLSVLLNQKNKIGEQLNRIALMVSDHIAPLTKLNCFDDDDRKYLGIRAQSILGSSNQQNFKHLLGKHNPVIKMYLIQREVVSTLQNIVTERSTKLKFTQYEVDETILQFFNSKQRLLIQLYRLEDEKLAFLSKIFNENSIDHDIFADASDLFINQRL